MRTYLFLPFECDSYPSIVVFISILSAAALRYHILLSRSRLVSTLYMRHLEHDGVVLQCSGAPLSLRHIFLLDVFPLCGGFR